MMIQSTCPLQLLVTARGPKGLEQGHGARNMGLSRSLVTAESRTEPCWNCLTTRYLEGWHFTSIPMLSAKKNKLYIHMHQDSEQ